MKRETLAQYVKRVMKEKGLNPPAVEKLSAKKITDAYVVSIVSGKQKNPSVSKLVALAEGLGVDDIELFKIAKGMAVDAHPPEPWPPKVLLEAVGKVVESPELTKTLKRLVTLKPAQLKELMSFMENRSNRA
ncbi:MAG TPA: helix-turn-helix transcriptional regulator [Blastocatellia bacterium]|nr:helix-turn-helix transcriptional regulator [Blastocatellia bacterium]